jgi:hypothetical protein
MNTPTVVASVAVLSAAVGLLGGPAAQALAAPTAALPATVRPQTANAEQCQRWDRSYEPSNNANEGVRDDVCWTTDPPTVRITSSVLRAPTKQPDSTCTLSPTQTSCVTNTWVRSRFSADFSSKQVTETSQACDHNQCVPSQHVFSFQ